MDKSQIVKLVANRYGPVEAMKFYLREAKGGLASMSNGIAEDKPMLAAKDLSMIKENLAAISYLLNDSDNIPALSSEAKNAIDK